MKLKLTFFAFIAFIYSQAQNTNFNQDTLTTFIEAAQIEKSNVSFESSNLPIVFISASVGGLGEGDMVEGNMGIVNNEGERNHRTDRRNDYNRKISIAYTGKDVFLFDKKSYLIETIRDNGENFDASILGMPKENDWILYAPYSDKTLLRNSLAHEMAKKAGYYSSRIGYCELVFNSQYHGVYILMEVVKKDENRVNISTLNEEDTVGNELTGGYIFKLDELPVNFKFGTDGWRAISDFPDAMDITFQYVYPKAKSISQQQKQYINEYISEFETVLGSETFNDPDDGYNKYIDVGSFVDYMLINEVSKAVTSFNEGVYFYKEKNTKGGKLFAGPMHDFSYGFNNADYWAVGSSTSSFAHADKWRLIYWWYRLMQDKYFYNLVYTRWNQLRENEFASDALNNYIDSVVSHIEEARIRNFEQWPIIGTYVYPNAYVAESYTDEITELKSWLSRRMTWMDHELFGTILQPTASISNTIWESTSRRAAISVSLSDEYFNKNILNKKYFTVKGLPAVVKIDTIFFNNASQATIVLSENATPETVTDLLSVTIDPSVLNGFLPVVSNELILGVSQELFDQKITVYTANNNLIIKSNYPELYPAYFNIYDLRGNLVKSFEMKKQDLELYQLKLKNGVYIVNINGSIKPVNQRITICY